MTAVANISDEMSGGGALGAPQSHSLTYSRIAQALSKDYYSIYYVDTETDRFIEYSAQSQYQKLQIEQSGEDFFEDCRRNILRVVHEEDRDKALAAFDKANLLQELENEPTYSITYRLMFDGVPVYVSLKVIRLEEEDNKHIVIGISNVDAQMKRQQEAERARAESLTFAGIAQALAADYFSIYYVDMETDRFIEYSSSEEYQGLNIEKGGRDFFNLSRKNILRVIYPEDQYKLLSAFTKMNVLRMLAQNQTFTLTYRLMFGDTPTYVNMKATRMDERHIVLGVSNVDAQMKQEEELFSARELANRDALTGVKSKHAFVEAEKELGERIDKGEALEFSIVICDVNGLKAINDNLGHKAGDEYIRAACSVICGIFKHSPVFRIGGDEFSVIL